MINSLATKTWGDKSHPKILALHGWLDNAASYDALATQLAEQFYVVAVDLPGHGLSEHTDDHHYPFEHYVDAIMATVDQLAWENFIIMGHSLGGAVASVVASKLPEKVSAFISLDAMGPLSTEVMQNSPAISMMTALILKAQRRPKTRYSSIEQMAERRAKMNRVSIDAVMPLVERATVKIDDHYQWRFDPKLLKESETYLSEAEVKTLLQAIQCPVLVIEAETGLLINSEVVAQRKAYFKHVSIIKLAGGHHLHLEKADVVAKQIIKFITALNLT